MQCMKNAETQELVGIFTSFNLTKTFASAPKSQCECECQTDLTWINLNQLVGVPLTRLNDLKP